MNEPDGKRFSWKTVGISLGTVIILTLLTLPLLPLAIESVLEQWVLEEYFPGAEIGDVDFNPFTATLVIKNLSASGPDTGGIELGTLRMQFRRLPFIKKRLYIAGLFLRNGTVDLVRKPEGWVVGGVPAAAGAGGQGAERPDAWQWGLDHIGLRNITIRFSGYDIEETIAVTEAGVDSYYSWKRDEPVLFGARVAFEKGGMDMDGGMDLSDGKKEIEAGIRINDLSLEGLAPFLEKRGLSSFTTVLGGTITLRVMMEADTGDGNIDAAGTLIFKETYGEFPPETDGISLRQDALSIQGDISAGIKGNAPAGVSGTANVTAEGFVMKGTKEDKTVAAAERVVVNGVSLDKSGVMGAAEARAHEMLFFERDRSGNDQGEGPPYILAVKTVAVKGVDIRERGYMAGDVVIDDLRGLITRDRDGTVDISRWIRDMGAMTGDKGEKGPSRKAHIRIGSVKVTKKSELTYVDHAVSPSFTARLSSLSLNVGMLDTQRPSRKIPVVLSATLDKYSAVTVKGTVSPLGKDPLTMGLQGKVTALDLPGLNPYMADSSYRVKSGHLDADIDWIMKGGVLDSEAGIVVSKLEVERAGDDGEAKGIFSSILGIPLDGAVSSLRDKDGIIKLNIPIEGDIRSPDFDFSNVILKASANALKKGVLSYYAPLGITLLTGTVLPPGALWLAERFIKFATHARFNPVEFQPMETILGPEAMKYLGEVAAHLTDKPDVRIVLCGTASPADLKALRAVDGDEKTEEPLKAVEVPGVEEKNRLLDLARDRSEAVKDFLVNNGIAPERLYLCDPGFDPGSDSLPRVEIAI